MTNEQKISELRENGVQVGEYCIIHESVRVGKGTEIMNYVELREGTVIGADCFIDSGVKMSGDCVIADDVTIRYDAIIAKGTRIGESSYICPQVMFNNRNEGTEEKGGANIGDHCFIGTNSTINHGVTISSDVIIGAKSFVNKSIRKPLTTWVGIPAKER